jgi:hypothetical protein
MFGSCRYAMKTREMEVWIGCVVVFGLEICNLEVKVDVVKKNYEGTSHSFPVYM